MAATPSGRGYWLVASDGGIFTFGDAHFYGSTGGLRLVQPIVGMATSPTGRGYWLVAADGGIFTFGDAPFYGSIGGHQLNQPVVGMAASPSGHGYWFVATDGGVFSYGDARFFGSTGGQALPAAIVAMAPTPDSGGYWLTGADGAVHDFGDARNYGTLAGHPLNRPIVGQTSGPIVDGFWLVATDGGIFSFNSGNAPVPSAGSGGSSSSYTFDGVNSDGSPYRWNPCAPIHYMISTAEAPPGAVADLQQAISMVSSNLHIPFTFDGTTNVLPSTSWLDNAPVGPDGWPPVLLGWEYPGQSDINLAYPIDASTLWRAMSVEGDANNLAMAAGVIAFSLNATGLSAGWGTDSWGEVYLHELGHMVGLAHVSDTSQMMNPYVPPIPAAYGNGDRTGLGLLGRGSCLTVYPR
jgi:hypothetical protein